MAKLSCDICGGNLIFIDSLDNLTCEICGVKYSKDAIRQKISGSNATTVTNISTEKIINLSVDSEKENMINRAEGFVLTKQYDKAVDTYRELINNYPNNTDVLKRYLDLSTNYHFNNFDTFVLAMNSLRELKVDTSYYSMTLYNNILNHSLDVFEFFDQCRRSNKICNQNGYESFKYSLINNLSLIFTKSQLRKIIEIGESNRKYAIYLSNVNNYSVASGSDKCFFLISNFAFKSSNGEDGVRYTSVKVEPYDKSMLVEYEKKHILIKSRLKDNVCIYCGGKYKGIFLNKCCTSCGRMIVPSYLLNENIRKIIKEVK